MHAACPRGLTPRYGWASVVLGFASIVDPVIIRVAGPVCRRMARQYLVSSFLALAAALLAPAAPAATLPAGFTDSTIASGLSSPTAMELLPDGRILVAEQGGSLRVVKNNALLATPFLSVNVNSSGERGLIGVAIDPNFATNGFVYVYYTTSGAPIHNRISRFTASPPISDVSTGAETILIDLDNLSSATNHNGGAMHFGPDGKLYVAVGDNANGANAQSMTTRHGKLLRYNADGTIPSDNPFFATASGANRAIWALGLRNPFTFAFQPGSALMYINDVGQANWEEVNEGDPGINFGWPGSEGPVGCDGATGYDCPSYAYDHSGGCAITGGVFYNPATQTFPAEYVGRYFFGDYCGDWIKLLDPAGPPASNMAPTFAAGVRAPVDLRVAPEGSLFYLARDAGTVGRIQYTADLAPSITQHPVSRTVPAGGNAAFACAATGSQPMYYQWQRNQTDISGATSKTLSLVGVVNEDGGSRYRCVASNAFGVAYSDEAALSVTFNYAPTGTIIQPAAGAKYNAGQTITFSASATDPEDGTLPPSAYTWRVDFHHDTHVHPFIAPFSGVAGGTFVIPDTGEASVDVRYRIYLTVRDSLGLAHTSYRDIIPNTVVLTLRSDVYAMLTFDGWPLDVPTTFVSVVGFRHDIGAALQKPDINDRLYQFVSWSDGGPRAHTITAPVQDTTYTAHYTDVTPINVALAFNGGVASASSTYSPALPPSGTNDGDVTGSAWTSGGGWSDSTANTWPDWLQISFSGQKTINRVVVYSLQDNPGQVPTDSMTFTRWGVTGFQVQTWTGSSWVTRASVTGNTLVKRTVTFAPVATDRVRVRVNSALASYSRIVEVEAWTPGPAPTKTTLTTPRAVARVGEAVTFTATVTGLAPTGTVEFRYGGFPAYCADVPLTGSGNTRTATCTTNNLEQGIDTVTAVYSGDGANATSSANRSVSVLPASGFAMAGPYLVDASPNPSPQGQPLRLTAVLGGLGPTGEVTFFDSGNPISGCTSVPLTGTEDERIARCYATTLPQGTRAITATYSGDAYFLPQDSYNTTWVVIGPPAPTVNIALPVYGSTATASSTYAGPGVNYAASSANNGDVIGTNWGSGGGWNDNTSGVWPDWLQIQFSGQKTIDKVIVYTLQDNYASPSAPTDAMTFSQFGVTGFQVQTWNGSSWVTQATITGNNLVKRTVTFAAVTTDRVRINVTSALASFSRIVEVEVWTASGGSPVATTTSMVSSLNPSTVGASVAFTATVIGSNPSGSVAFKAGANAISGCSAVALTGSGDVRTAGCSTSVLAQGTHSITAVYAGDPGNQTSTSSALMQIVDAGASSTNVASAANGGVVSASSTYSAGFSASGANNGEVAGNGWGSNGGWNDSTGGAWPDWLQVNFSGQKTINKIVVYTVQDNYASPSTPTDSMTFSLYGITGFQVQTWNGSSWVTQANVTGNNLVKRTVTFAAVATDRIRINVTSALASYSRIVEVEAWTP